MDIDSLSKGIKLISDTITTLKKLKDFLPSGKEKKDIEQDLNEAENKIMIAEAELAKGFGYQLCQRHFPPGIQIEIAPFKSKCSVCGYITDYED